VVIRGKTAHVGAGGTVGEVAAKDEVVKHQRADVVPSTAAAIGQTAGDRDLLRPC
jgi:hypothetical protein